MFYGSKEPAFPQRVPVFLRNRIFSFFLYHLQPFGPYIHKHVSLAATFQRGNRFQITEKTQKIVVSILTHISKLLIGAVGKRYLDIFLNFLETSWIRAGY